MKTFARQTTATTFIRLCLILSLLLIGKVTASADDMIYLSVGESRTLFLPDYIISKNPYYYNCQTTSQDVHVSFTSKTIHIAAVSPSEQWAYINYEYFYLENNIVKSGRYTIQVFVTPSTAIGPPASAPHQAPQRIHSLGGTRLSQPQKGLNIIDGRLVLKK